MDSIIKLPATIDQEYFGRGVYSPYGATEGCLGAYMEHSVDWETCREVFHETFPRVDRMLFLTQKVDQVIAFIEASEIILGVPKNERAKLYKTTTPYILYIRMGSFWRKRVRRELFTILIRAGRQYSLKTQNFWKAARGDVYLRDTWSAFQRFMAGHTVYRGRNLFEGWVDTFHEKYISETNSLNRLVKKCPSKTKENMS